MAWRRLITPRWIIATVLVVALVALLVSLGLWQLRRLDERQLTNARLAARSTPPALDFTEVVDLATTNPDDVEYQLVRVDGTYLLDQEILIRNRSREGQPGWHVTTPLLLDNGNVVIVNRGWIPFRYDGLNSDPPAGQVTVAGLIYKSHTKGRLAASDAADGVLTDMARIDLPRITQQINSPLYPVYIQAETGGAIPDAPLPAPIARPADDNGPHFSYAMQWFIFATIAGGGWLLLIRRELIRRDPQPHLPDKEPALS